MSTDQSVQHAFFLFLRYTRCLLWRLGVAPGSCTGGECSYFRMLLLFERVSDDPIILQSKTSRTCGHVQVYLLMGTKARCNASTVSANNRYVFNNGCGFSAAISTIVFETTLSAIYSAISNLVISYHSEGCGCA